MPLDAVTLGPAPALVARSPGSRGSVLLLHGYAADALANARELELLGRAGWCGVGLDAPAHGRRYDPQRERRWAQDRDAELCRLARMAGAELPAVVDAMRAEGLPEPYGIVGVSLGAISAWAGLVREPRLVAGALVLGTPELPCTDSPHRSVDALRGRPLLAINAEHDEVVPLAPTRDLIEQLNPNDAAMRVVPGAGHMVPEQDWWLLWGRVLEFFDARLAR